MSDVENPVEIICKLAGIQVPRHGTTLLFESRDKAGQVRVSLQPWRESIEAEVKDTAAQRFIFKTLIERKKLPGDHATIQGDDRLHVRISPDEPHTVKQFCDVALAMHYPIPILVLLLQAAGEKRYQGYFNYLPAPTENVA